ncbi:MAG: universal stress protein [Ilumatobacter sp.]
MTNTWIVGLDGSDESESALRWATERAVERDERVRPVAAWHVPLPIWLLSGRRVVDVDRAGLSAEVAVHSAAAVDRLQSDADVDEPRVIEGDPGSVLLDQADSGDTIVVGRRGVGRVRHRVLGSVSRHVATHACGPVVVVPDQWESAGLHRVIVGFDGSEHAAAALAWALGIAPDDAEVVALCGLDVIPWLEPDTVVDRHPEAIAHARERICAVADEVDPQRRAVRSFVVDGPRHALAGAMDDADLVVVGPRGIGGLASALLGSVTAWLLHEATCPVAVVPTSN